RRYPMNRTPPRRLFAPLRPHRRIGLLHLVAVLLTLAACTPRTENWSPADSPRRNLVSWVEFHHSVRFGGGSTALEAAEREALDRFLGRIADGEGVRVALAGTSADPAVAVGREAVVAAYI